jgi:hypothetical protein
MRQAMSGRTKQHETLHELTIARYGKTPADNHRQLERPGHHHRVRQQLCRAAEAAEQNCQYTVEPTGTQKPDLQFRSGGRPSWSSVATHTDLNKARPDAIRSIEISPVSRPARQGVRVDG